MAQGDDKSGLRVSPWLAGNYEGDGLESHRKGEEEDRLDEQQAPLGLERPTSKLKKSFRVKMVRCGRKKWMLKDPLVRNAGLFGKESQEVVFRQEAKLPRV